MARPSCRVPTIMTAISQVSGLGQIATSAMLAMMVPQQCATSHNPRQELREVSRLHSSGVKTVLGSMRATAGMGSSSPKDFTSIRGPGHDTNFGGEGAVHRTFVRDFQDALALVGVERTLETDATSIWSSMPSLVSHSAQSFA